jgi:hypothetical protein
MPKRVQLSRAKGWRKPEGAIVVSRPSRWGNPFRVGDPGVPDAATAARLYSEALLPYRHHGPAVSGSKLEDFLITQANIDSIVLELRGHDLCCWCQIGAPCHGDVLLEIANGESMDG